eukprot:gene19072-24377_t
MVTDFDIAGSAARYLVAQGARVVFLGRDQAKLDLARTDCAGLPGEAATFSVDVLDRPGLERVRDEVVARFGRIDALINAAGGNVTFANALNLGTGTLGGSGTITAPSVTAGGIVAPGNSPGALTLTGDLTLLATATSRFEIGGLTAGTQYDTLNVSGTAALNGTLELKFVN